MYCTTTVLWERGHDNRQSPAYCVSRSRVFRDSEPVQDVLLVPGETRHDQIRHLRCDDTDHHTFLDWDDDMQYESLYHHIHHRHCRLFRLDYFFAGSAVFASTLVVGA